MHPTSLENMQLCFDRYVRPAGYEQAAGVRVLDVGGADVNGSYREIFSNPAFVYQTADIATEGVDISLADPYHLPLPDASVDILLSGQMLEHCERFWLAFQEMVRVMQPAGFLFLIAPSAGPIHRYPVDCYRFYPDAYHALARLAGCQLIDCWRDERGPWQDLVGVFRKEPIPPALTGPSAEPPLSVSGHWQPPPVPEPAAERCAGSLEYLAFLERVHQFLSPRGYLEIGIRHGHSLAMATCPALGIDPQPAVDRPLAPTTRVVAESSDDFFRRGAPEAAGLALDLVFIDGLHLFEYALRDFMHCERHATASSLVLIDDVLPCHPFQARRQRQTRVWTGDLWKLIRCLAEQRPDLYLLLLDTWPTGTLLVAGLDPGNRVLWEGYNPIVRNYRDRHGDEPPPAILARQAALRPDAPLIGALCQRLRTLRDLPEAARQPAAVVAALRGLTADTTAWLRHV